MKVSTTNLFMFALKDCELQENVDFLLYLCIQNIFEECMSGHSPASDIRSSDHSMIEL